MPFFSLRNSSQWGRTSHRRGLMITLTHHTRYDSSGRVISSSQRPLPVNTQHSQETDINSPAEFKLAIPTSKRWPLTARPLRWACNMQLAGKILNKCGCSFENIYNVVYLCIHSCIRFILAREPQVWISGSQPVGRKGPRSRTALQPVLLLHASLLPSAIQATSY